MHPALMGLQTADRRPSVAARVSLPERAVEKMEEADIEDATEVIASCAEDMSVLWQDPAVRAVLSRRGMRPEEGPGL